MLRHAWLNLWDKHMTTGRINQVTTNANNECWCAVCVTYETRLCSRSGKIAYSDHRGEPNALILHYVFTAVPLKTSRDQRIQQICMNFCIKAGLPWHSSEQSEARVSHNTADPFGTTIVSFDAFWSSQYKPVGNAWMNRRRQYGKRHSLSSELYWCLAIFRKRREQNFCKFIFHSPPYMIGGYGHNQWILICPYNWAAGQKPVKCVFANRAARRSPAGDDTGSEAVCAAAIRTPICTFLLLACFSAAQPINALSNICIADPLQALFSMHRPPISFAKAFSSAFLGFSEIIRRNKKNGNDFLKFYQN